MARPDSRRVSSSRDPAAGRPREVTADEAPLIGSAEGRDPDARDTRAPEGWPPDRRDTD